MTKIIKWLWQCIDILITCILVMMVVLVFSNVVLRYGFDSGIRASVELSRLGLVWIVLLGAAVVLRRGEHLAVTEFSEHFLPSAVPILNRLIWLVVLFSSGMLLVGAVNRATEPISQALADNEDYYRLMVEKYYVSDIKRKGIEGQFTVA